MQSSELASRSQSLRDQMNLHYRQPEAEAVAKLLSLLDSDPQNEQRVLVRARALAEEIRRVQSQKTGVDVLLKEFSLSSEEGVLLMCLAEALLRIPDDRTQDQLIRDKLAGGDWSAHLGKSGSMFVNASAWGLLLTGKVVSLKNIAGNRTQGEDLHWALLRNTVSRLGEPVIRLAMNSAIRILSTQFVLGEDIESALDNSAEEQLKGYNYSFDMLGEGARTARDADRYMAAYEAALEVIGREAEAQGPILGHGLSVKLSALHPRFEFTKRQRIFEELVPKVKQLARRASRLNVGLTIDAEESERLDISLDLIETVFSDPEFAGWNGFGIAIQAYQKRAVDVVDWAVNLAKLVNRSMMIRLVKGAYWDSEIKRSQVEGLDDYPVYTRKCTTDLCYLVCAQKLMQNRGFVYPQFATHNALTVAAILEMAKLPSETGNQAYEFQRLHGMGDVLYDRILKSGDAKCRIYAPVGVHQDLLAYLVRRILENGANSSFVNNIVDESVTIDELLVSPADEAQQSSPKLNPAIRLPASIYRGYRKNSRGLDLTDSLGSRSLLDAMANWTPVTTVSADHDVIVYNPSKTSEIVGGYRNSSSDDVNKNLQIVAQGLDHWAATSVTERAGLLENLADLLQRNRNELIVLCVKEAGKTLSDGIAEVREAIDFCYYYAEQARKLAERGEETTNEDRCLLDGRRALGVVLCISPWNFPLAIFLGQVSAALVAGNTVIAKPAEQTSLIALRVRQLIWQSGIPESAFQLVAGPGKQIGEILVSDKRVSGIMFTGSTETATWISHRLSMRGGKEVRFIAETGGQNAMIVDSTALPEAVVDDVLTSGFHSAGQRCSALRVLFLQEDIADRIISMLKGAMAELSIGDPAELATDLGPVIDQRALTMLSEHEQRMNKFATLLAKCPPSSLSDQGYYFSPSLYEIKELSILTREVFGPVVHVIRYAADKLDEVIAAINGTGYGLTLGIHTRIESKAEYIANNIKVGNVYINRNMIGAVVGVQPFGGCGLSGTGPKAGGPNYLRALLGQPMSTAGDDSAKSSRPDSEEFLLAEVAYPLVEKVNDLIAIAANARQDQFADRIKWLSDFQTSNSTWLRSVSGKSPESGDLCSILADSISVMGELLAQPTQLPGPTGESNELLWEPRGIVACFTDQNSLTWFRSVCTGLLTGNQVIVIHDEDQEPFLRKLVQLLRGSGFSTGSIQSLTLGKRELWSCILLNKDIELIAVGSKDRHFAEYVMAGRNGALIPLVTASPGCAFFHRFMREKTITINTTAAGGNASLMMAAADPTRSIDDLGDELSGYRQF